MRARPGLALWLTLAVAPVGGCRRSGPAPGQGVQRHDPAPAAASLPPVAAAPVAAPLPQERLPTTDGSLAVGNLNASIHARERLLQGGPDRAHQLALAALLGLRARYLGQLADYERALDLTEEAVRRWPKDGAALLARATARAALHRFAEAEADLAAARKLEPALAGRADEIRAGILAALGQIAAALALAEQQGAAAPELSNLALQASLRADLGQLDRADALFTEAQRHHRDVSPFPVAWLYLQHGLMWQRAGRPARARALLEAAVERLPQYAAAVSHLAGVESVMGERARAEQRLRALVARSDDPEYLGQLAALLAGQGPAQAAEAQALRARTAAGYAALLGRQPAAFASHAARFYLGSGDLAQAAVWARRHLAAAPAPEAYELALEVAVAGRAADACALAERALAQPVVSALARVQAARAFAGCGQAARAEQILKLPGLTPQL